MAYFVYILQSEKNGRYYTGSTDDLTRRLKEHNSGNTKSTKRWRPWKIIYLEEQESKTEAMRREYRIKRYKGGRAFKKLIQT